MILFAHSKSSHGWLIEIWELHPALTHLPIAFLLGGVVLDLYVWRRGRPDLGPFVTGLLIAGVVSGIISALAGVVAFFTVPAHTEEAHALMFWHMAIQATALLVFACPAIERWRKGSIMPSLAGRLAGIVGALLLIVGSGIGGYIVYHGGAGVAPELLASSLRQHRHGESRQQGSKERDSGPVHQHEDDRKQPEPRSSDATVAMYEKTEAMEHTAYQLPAEQPAHDQKMPAPHEKKPTAKDKSAQRGHDHKESDPGKNEAKKDSAHEGHGRREIFTLPAVPPASAAAAYVPRGHTVQVVLYNLNYPSSLDLDDKGNLYIAEAGEVPGGPKTPARVVRIRIAGEVETIVSDGLVAPVTGVHWHQGRLYITHKGKISAWSEKGGLVDVLSGLASAGVDPNKQIMTEAADGRLYLGHGHRLVRIDAKTTKVETYFGRPEDARETPAAEHKDHSTPARNGQEHHDHGTKGSGHKEHGNHPKQMNEHQGHEKKRSGHDDHATPAKKSPQLMLEDSVTAGPRHLVAMRFAPGGEALYVVDFGAVFMTPDGTRAVPGTGVVWRILRDDAAPPVLLP